LTDLLVEWTKGRRGSNDMALYEELCHAMRLTSICGLGQVVHAPIGSVMKHFPEEVDAHAKGICPAGVCFPPRAVV
jgi:NADH:ubiquinone oxidoreductase subunit F (NADH-binding)